MHYWNKNYKTCKSTFLALWASKVFAWINHGVSSRSEKELEHKSSFTQVTMSCPWIFIQKLEFSRQNNFFSFSSHLYRTKIRIVRVSIHRDNEGQVKRVSGTKRKWLVRFSKWQNSSRNFYQIPGLEVCRKRIMHCKIYPVVTDSSYIHIFDTVYANVICISIYRELRSVVKRKGIDKMIASSEWCEIRPCGFWKFVYL